MRNRGFVEDTDMRPPMMRRCSHWFQFGILALFLSCGTGFGQENTGNPINLDEALSEEKEDRGLSYYHYSLGKWHENRGELDWAVVEIKKAVELNEGSSELRVELASSLAQSRRIAEAIQQATEGSRLDPNNPDAYWLLAKIYNGSTSRDRSAHQKAIKQLEAMRRVAPKDPRAYRLLGEIYFKLDEIDQGIRAYETLQSLRPNRGEGYTRIAAYFAKSGKLDQAIQYYEKAIASEPDSVESLLRLALIYTQLRQDDKAVPLYRKAIELNMTDPQVKEHLGRSLLNIAEFEEAADVLGELVESSPGNLDLLTFLGRAQLGAKQTNKAIETFSRALKLNPGNLEAEFYIAIGHEEEGNYPEAAKVLEGLLEKTENPSGTYTDGLKTNREVFKQHLASVYQEMGLHGRAIDIFREMLDNNAEENTTESKARVLFLLINAYRINRQLDQALAIGRSEFGKRPEDKAIALVYARTLADSGKEKEGAKILKNLIQKDPLDVDLHINLSQIYIQAKRFSEAEEILSQAQDIAKDEKQDQQRLKFQLAALYERKKDYRRAENLFKELIEENPDNATALNYIGYMLADRGIRLHEAVEYVERALVLEPNNGAYLDSLGWAYFKLNNLEKAEQYLLQAVEIVRKDPDIHAHLGDLYYKAGEYDKAESYWNKSLENVTDSDEGKKVRNKLKKLKELLRKQKRL